MSMRMNTPDGTEVMVLEKIERSGNTLLLKSVVMGAMPMTVVVRPEEARKIFAMLSVSLFIFLLTFIFRSSRNGQPSIEGYQ